MALETRQNPDTLELEVLIDGQWQSFDHYRKHQIDSAYAKSIQFLRDRLEEDDIDSKFKANSKNDEEQNVR